MYKVLSQEALEIQEIYLLVFQKKGNFLGLAIMMTLEKKASYILELRISDVFSMIVKVTDSSQKHSLSDQAKSYHTP